MIIFVQNKNKMYCTKCKKDKDDSSFRLRKSMKRGRTSWCRECESESVKNKYIPKPRRVKEKKNYDSLGALKRQLKSRYSITYDEYLFLYQKQNGMCAICGDSKPLGGRNGLYIDHNHKNGAIRGLLCPSCNSAIGKLKEDILLMQRAISYLMSS